MVPSLEEAVDSNPPMDLDSLSACSGQFSSLENKPWQTEVFDSLLSSWTPWHETRSPSPAPALPAGVWAAWRLHPS